MQAEMKEREGEQPQARQAWGGQLWRGWLVQVGWGKRGLRAGGARGGCPERQRGAGSVSTGAPGGGGLSSVRPEAVSEGWLGVKLGKEVERSA